MILPITTRALATTPSNPGEAFAFLDSGNANALTLKYQDCTYQVIQGQIKQLEANTALNEALDKVLDKLTCAVAKGTISMAEYNSFISNFNLYFVSELNASGDLNQSITSTPPDQVPSDDNFVVSDFAPIDAGVMALAGANGVASSTDLTLSIDRDGVEGDVAVALSGAPAGVTISGNSYISDNAGVNVAYPDVIKQDSSLFDGAIAYDGTAAAGTYTFAITLTAGLVTKNISVSLTIA